jgi:hypothetical protein
MAKLTDQEKAQLLALRGDTDAAQEALTELKKRGDDGVSASLAVIAAFRSQWGEVLKHVESVLTSPSCVETFNAYADMVLLAARAASETGEWDTVHSIAKMASKKLAKLDDSESHVEAVRRLSDFTKRKGDGTGFTLQEDDSPMPQRKARFEAAIAKLENSPKKRFRTPADRLDHLFALAGVLHYHAGAVLLFDQEKNLPNIFDNVVFAASSLARAGRAQDAWNAIKTKLPLWWPVDSTQIAPVELLADDALNKLMSPARREEVLRCPRGPAAQ